MTTLVRHSKPKMETIKLAMKQPQLLLREYLTRDFHAFFVHFWPVISSEPLIDNWHIKYLCNVLQKIQTNVSNRRKKEADYIINIPPGTSKTSIISVMYPVWCWVRDYTLKLITASYSSALSLESAEMSRELIRSAEFQWVFPELAIKDDKDTKSNYRVIRKRWFVKGKQPRIEVGGNRYSTSVGGTVTGFHGHILIVDDPLNPHESQSKQILQTTNHWCDQVLSMRKVNKEVSVIIIVMQRLHQKDPSGYLLNKRKKSTKHICLPGEIDTYGDNVNPPELKENYVDGLLDPIRLSRDVLAEMLTDLGQYGYAGQVGQQPAPPSGGMFKVDMFQIITTPPLPHDIHSIVRYWDKAGTVDAGAYTVGVKLAKLKNGRFIVMDVKRGQWGSDVRENIIKATAEADGDGVFICTEQEPGSGGKESAEATIKNLAGYMVSKDTPKGDKTLRADPYSVQVNQGNVGLLYGDWNADYIEEFKFFPLSTYKDQVDASSGAFAQLTKKKEVKSW